MVNLKDMSGSPSKGYLHADEAVPGRDAAWPAAFFLHAMLTHEQFGLTELRLPDGFLGRTTLSWQEMSPLIPDRLRAANMPQAEVPYLHSVHITSANHCFPQDQRDHQTKRRIR